MADSIFIMACVLALLTICLIFLEGRFELIGKMCTNKLGGVALTMLVAAAEESLVKEKVTGLVVEVKAALAATRSRRTLKTSQLGSMANGTQFLCLFLTTIQRALFPIDRIWLGQFVALLQLRAALVLPSSA